MKIDQTAKQWNGHTDNLLDDLLDEARIVRADLLAQISCIESLVGAKISQLCSHLVRSHCCLCPPGEVMEVDTSLLESPGFPQRQLC